MAWGGAAFLATSLIIFVGYKVFVFFYPTDDESYQDMSDVVCIKPPIAVVSKSVAEGLNEYEESGLSAKYLQLLGTSSAPECNNLETQLPPSYADSLNNHFCNTKPSQAEVTMNI